jgi:hypothetical protein
MDKVQLYEYQKSMVAEVVFCKILNTEAEYVILQFRSITLCQSHQNVTWAVLRGYTFCLYRVHVLRTAKAPIDQCCTSLTKIRSTLLHHNIAPSLSGLFSCAPDKLQLFEDFQL